jgi:hypothetical protein
MDEQITPLYGSRFDNYTIDESIEKFLDMGGDFRILKQNNRIVLAPHIKIDGNMFRKGVFIESLEHMVRVFPEVASETLKGVEKLKG